MKAWVAGEALIDLFATAKGQEAIVGGGPANTAKALSRLGVPTSFIGGISSDEFGRMILDELAEVDLGFVHRSELPTALARVSLDLAGSARYEFHLENTSTFDFRREWLPVSKPTALHIGTLATIVEPGANELFEWAKALKIPIIFDPNVRPSFLSDQDKYRRAIERWVEIATIVKLSDEDLAWLGYENANHFFELGAKLVVVTRGAAGIIGYRTDGFVSVPGIRVEVADTVGAGDTVGAILVEGVIKFGLDMLNGEKLYEVLIRAAKAAAITCTRVGANPPTLDELERF